MAVPKRFRFKKKKTKVLKINDASGYISLFKNKDILEGFSLRGSR